MQTDALGRPKITRQSRTRLTRRRIVPANIWSLAHARADGCETDGEAGADGGERRDPHCAALAKAQRRRCLRVRMVHDGAFSVSLDSQIATRAQQGVSAKASLNRIPKLPPDRRAASKTAKLCLRFQYAKEQHACLGMRCLRGHQRHGAFSCHWLGAACSLCHCFGSNTVSSVEPARESACCVRKAVCSQAAQGCGGGMRRGWGRSSTGCGHKGREKRTWHHLPTRLMPPRSRLT